MDKNKIIEFILKLSIFVIGLSVFYFFLFLNVYEGYGIIETRGMERGMYEAALLAIGIIASVWIMFLSVLIPFGFIDSQNDNKEKEQ